MIALSVPEAGMAIGHNSIRPFLSLFFSDVFQLSAATTGTAIAIMALAGGAGALVTPRIAARLGNIRAIAALRLTSGVMVLLWFAGLGLGGVLAFMFIYYSFMDGTEAIFITEAMSRLPDERRTWFSGIYAMVWSIAASGGSVLSGVLRDHQHGFGAAFSFGFAGYAFSFLWMLVVFGRLPSLIDSAPPASLTVPV